MQTPTTDTETTDTDAPKQDSDYYTEMWWDNTDYHTGGSLRLRVFKVLEKLILSSEIADQLTSEVYWKSVRYSHRWSIRGNAASAYVLNLAREIALDYICKNATRVDGALTSKASLSLWANILAESPLTATETQVILLFTGNFIQEQEKTESQEEGSFRPLDAEEIAEALDKEESENAPDEETNSLTADDVREIIELASEKFRKAFSNIVTTKKEN